MKSRLFSLLLLVKHAVGRLYRFLREWLAIPRDYAVDQYRYMRWSGSFAPGRSRQALQGLIMRLYHGVEVGLTYENPRPGFGLKVVNDLLGYLRIYVQKFGADQTVRIAVHVLRLYLDHNRAQGLALESVAKKLDRLKVSPESQEGEGGILTLQRQDILQDAAIDFSRFVASRHSFRRYESDPVPLERIEQAVRMAMQSPSA
ncbi:hypothetical protein JW992_05765, partial [candidate division KSB1 bacterium]|nr:hypothetical protein [candidate division KSB1 bacterium]